MWRSPDWVILLCSLLPGVVLAPGCGGPSSVAHNSPSGAATASGGNLASGLPAPRPAEPRTIDLRTLPHPARGKFSICTADRLEGIANGKASEIFAHYRAALEKLGWKRSAPPAKGQVTDNSASALLIKGDESIFLSVIPGPPGEGETDGGKQFSVGNLGKCDSSKLPRLPGAEQGYAGKISTLYFIDMRVAATAASVRNMLQSDGWQEFSKPYAPKPPETEIVRQEFRKQGNSLRLLISPAPVDDQKARSSVQYVIGAIGHQLPAPADATDVQFDDALCLLRCSIPRDLDPTARYYLDAMTSLGYEASKEPSPDRKDAVIIGKANDGDDLLVDLVYDAPNTRAQLSLLRAASTDRMDRKPYNKE